MPVEKAFTAGFYEVARIPMTTERTLVVNSSETAFGRPALQLVLEREGRPSIFLTIALDKLAELRRSLDAFESRACLVEQQRADDPPGPGRGRPRGKVVP